MVARCGAISAGSRNEPTKLFRAKVTSSCRLSASAIEVYDKDRPVLTRSRAARSAAA